MLHTCTKVPLQREHAALSESQLSPLPPASLSSVPVSLGTTPGHMSPCPRPLALWGASLGDSPGKSTFHLGLFWPMRTNCPSPWAPGLARLP